MLYLIHCRYYEKTLVYTYSQLKNYLHEEVNLFLNDKNFMEDFQLDAYDISNYINKSIDLYKPGENHKVNEKKNEKKHKNVILEILDYILLDSYIVMLNEYNTGKNIDKMEQITTEQLYDILMENPVDILLVAKYKNTGSHKVLPYDILKEVKKALNTNFF